MADDNKRLIDERFMWDEGDIEVSEPKGKVECVLTENK